MKRQSRASTYSKGFAMEEITLKVTGMHCPKCDARVEKAVGAIAGVESAKADHESDSVTIAYDGAAETLAAARAAIVAEDFTVED